MGVLVLGSLNVDLVAYVPRMPNAGETIHGTAFKTFAGGKGLNQAVAAARAGAKTSMAGALGADSHATFLRNLMAQEKISSHAIVTKPSPTGTAFIEVDEAGANRIIVFGGANTDLLPEDVTDELLISISEPRIILAQLEVPLAVIEAIFARAKKLGFITVLNPAPAADLDETLLKNIDLLIPNEHEAALLTGIPITDRDSAEVAGKLLLDRGVKSVIITMGAAGAIFMDANGTQIHGAFPILAIDTTAAGDAFCGAIVASIGIGKSIKESLPMACAAGAIAATRSGATPSLPTEEEILSFLNDR